MINLKIKKLFSFVLSVILVYGCSSELHAEVWSYQEWINFIKNDSRLCAGEVRSKEFKAFCLDMYLELFEYIKEFEHRMFCDSAQKNFESQSPKAVFSEVVGAQPINAFESMCRSSVSGDFSEISVVPSSNLIRLIGVELNMVRRVSGGDETTFLANLITLKDAFMWMWRNEEYNKADISRLRGFFTLSPRALPHRRFRESTGTAVPSCLKKTQEDFLNMCLRSYLAMDDYIKNISRLNLTSCEELPIPDAPELRALNRKLSMLAKCCKGNMKEFMDGLKVMRDEFLCMYCGIERKG